MRRPGAGAASGLLGVHGSHTVSDTNVDRDRLARSDADADATGTTHSEARRRTHPVTHGTRIYGSAYTDASYRACADARGYDANT